MSEQEGEGFVQSVIDFTRQIFTGRDKLAANSQKKLDKWKDYEIEGVKIVRKPIMKGINKLANYLTDGKFKKDMLKNGYDDLFHLRVDVKLKNGPCLTVEKNESVAISRGKCENLNEDGLEAMEIEVKKPRTFGEAYERMTKGYGSAKNLYDYDSVNNNCQRFVDTYLSKNSDAFNYTAEDKKFVKQDVKFIVENYEKLKKGAKVITNLAQRLSLFYTGAGENKISTNDIQQENMSEQEGEGLKDIVKGVKKGVKKVAKVAKKGAKIAKVASKVVEVGAKLTGNEELEKKAKKVGKTAGKVQKTSKQLGGQQPAPELTPQSSQPPGRAGNPIAMGKNPTAIKMTGGAMKDRIISNSRKFKY
jgi:hypothetical protein